MRRLRNLAARPTDVRKAYGLPAAQLPYLGAAQSLGEARKLFKARRKRGALPHIRRRSRSGTQTIKTNVAREGLGITDSYGPDNRFHQLAGPTDYVLLVDSLLSPTKLVNAS